MEHKYIWWPLHTDLLYEGSEGVELCWGLEIWPCDAGVRLTPINNKQRLAKGCYVTLPGEPEALREMAKALTAIASSLEQTDQTVRAASNNNYSVLALYPEQATDDYGGDYYFAHTQAPNAFDAACQVQQIASEANDGNIDPDDFRPIAVFEGEAELALGALEFGETLANDTTATTTEHEITDLAQPPALTTNGCGDRQGEQTYERSD